MSGNQEPWVFRGGLVADLQRLIPVDNANDLFIFKFPDRPVDRFLTVRPYAYTDEETLFNLWTRSACSAWGVDPSAVPESIRQLSADCVVGPFVTLSPAFSLVIEEDGGTEEESSIIGFICGAPDAKQFRQSSAMCWWPSLAEKYPKERFSDASQLPELRSPLDWFAKQVHDSADALDDCPGDVLSQYPATMVCCVWPANPLERGVAKRLATLLFAVLRSTGAFGVHTWIEKNNVAAQEFYAKLGFSVVHEDACTGRSMLGRKF